MYYAHTTEKEDKSDWQTLEEHLKNVAEISSAFAKDFNAGEFAYAGGLLHDIGKYSPEFQQKLEGRNIRVDHSTAGAREAGSLYPPLMNRFLEYIIAGHHGGIPNYGTKVKGLERRIHSADLYDYRAYKNKITTPELDPGHFNLTFGEKNQGFTCSFYIRMLYSCLVDADSLDTEQFTRPDQAARRGMYDTFDELFNRFEDHTKAFAKIGESRINRCRNDVLRQCKEKARLPPQMFTLTVPTGGGKTLSSMAFSLDHLKKNDLKRIFYVIPYTSIIEQNADVFRKIFGNHNVLEHHSNYDPKQRETEATDPVRESLTLSTENWDIPLVVTTNVQFFESLFSNRRSKCRKIHNLSKSVIILDEAQMLPIGYLKPCLAALSELVLNYGSTVVICTATQPKIGSFLDERTKPLEIVDSPEELYETLRRVHVNNAGELDDEELSDRLRDLKQVLCIVNTRKHASSLFDTISASEGSDGCFHLSAAMCPVHRRTILKEIRNRLKDGLPCRVISTQLIEAGVDIDFPVVYRAMTGIDSVAQAAGRCNREGKSERGEVYVFRSAEVYGKATSWQKRVAEIGEMIFNEYEDPLSLDAVGRYFHKLYYYQGNDRLDKKGILQSLDERLDELAFPFEDVNDAFAIIENGTKDVVIPWDDDARFRIEKIRKNGFPENFGRGLQGYTVAVYPQVFRELEKSRALDTIGERFHVLTDMSLYSEKTGLMKPTSGDLPLLIT
ncbi:CRISPR-associated helicase Cas3' [Methanogenium cariaci]